MSILLNSFRLSPWMWHTVNSLSLALTVTVIQFWHVSSRLCVCVCLIFIYSRLLWVFLAVCWPSLAAASGGYSQVVALGLLVVLTSLVVDQTLELRLSSGGAWALLPLIIWDLPRPGIEHMSPALAGGFLTTEAPGKSYACILSSNSEIPRSDRANWYVMSVLNHVLFTFVFTIL